MGDSLDAVTVLILAAGGGTRLGGGKLLLPWRGAPLVLHSVRTALRGSDGPVHIVVGCDADAVRDTIQNGIAGCDGATERVCFVDNPEWADGQSTSLRRGLGALKSGGAGGIVMLADQPDVLPETLRTLAAAHRRHFREYGGCSATRPAYQGRDGNPVVLGPGLFPDIMALCGDVGARDIIGRLGDKLLRVPVDDAGVVRDIDTPADYGREEDHS